MKTLKLVKRNQALKLRKLKDEYEAEQLPPAKKGDHFDSSNTLVWLHSNIKDNNEMKSWNQIKIGFFWKNLFKITEVIHVSNTNMCN